MHNGPSVPMFFRLSVASHFKIPSSPIAALTLNISCTLYPPYFHYWDGFQMKVFFRGLLGQMFLVYDFFGNS